MTSAVQFRSIRIDRMLGIAARDGFELRDLSPGVNLLFGPNGSGKSTIGRAMLISLFGGSEAVWRQLVPGAVAASEPERRRMQVSSTMALPKPDGRHGLWTVDLEAGLVSSTVDGRPETLSVGSPELAQRYRLGLVDLLAESNEEFARAMLRQAAGGIDLEEIGEGLGWAALPPMPQAREVKRAREELQRLEREQAELARRSSELDELRARRAELDAIIAQADVVKSAIECLELQDRIDELDATRGGFPGLVRDLKGDEGARCRRLDEERKIANDRHQEDARRLAEHKRIPALLGDDERRALGQPLEPAFAAVERLRLSEEAHRSAVRDVELASDALEGARRTLASTGLAADGSAGRVDADAIRQAGEIARLAHVAGAAREQRNELRRQFESSQWRRGIREEALPDATAIGRAWRALVGWLQAERGGASPDAGDGSAAAPMPAWTWYAILGAALLAIALAVLVHPVAATGLLAAALAAWLAFGRGAPPASRSGDGARGGDETLAAGRPDQSMKRAEFERIARDVRGIEHPREWSDEAVEERIESLLVLAADRARLDAALPLQDKLDELEREVVAREGALRRACEEFEAAHGLGAFGDGRQPVDSGWLLWVVRSVSDWREREDARAGAVERCEVAGARLRSMQDALRTEMARVGLGLHASEDGDAASMSAGALRGLERLRDRREKHLALAQQYENLLEQERRTAASHAALEDEWTRFWTGLDLAPDDRSGLDSILGQHQRLQDVIAERAVAETRRLECERGLGTRSDLLFRSLDDLRQEAEVIRNARADLNKMSEEIGALEREMSLASEGSRMAEAQLALDAAHEALRGREAEWMSAKVRRTVLSWARESLQQGVVTPVVHRARQLVSRFTNGGLDFEVGAPEAGAPPAFRARTKESEPWRTVDRLSSGERIQLLMAVRLAFLEESEDRMLPIFLDEVLGSSDDDRAGRMIDAVIAIARTGRQVFYATAQADEIAKWESRLAESEVEWRRIDLAEVRGRERVRRFPLPPPPPSVPPVPKPDGTSHGDYGRLLGVPDVDWSEPGLASLHPWHLIDDPATLHRVLEQGLETLGKLESVTRFATDDFLVGVRDDGRIRAAACAYRAAGEAWSTGRGPRLTREALDEAAGVSDVFRDRIWSIVEEVGGDARKLVHRLRTRAPDRWRDKSTIELDQWLRSRGFLSDDEPLGLSAIELYVRGELSKGGLHEAFGPEAWQRLRASLAAAVGETGATS